MYLIRFVAMGLTISLYFIVCALNYPFMALFPFRGRKNTANILKFFCHIGLWLCGIRPSFKELEKIKGARLITCNHLSYLDVLVIASRIPTAFVTSVEVKNTPFLGHLVRITGCLFVERRSKANIRGEVKMFEDALEEGLSVLFFPEATSHDGTELLRFRRPLFYASLNTGIPVLPLCINWRSINGVPITAKNRDAVFWYGDMTFWDHYKNLFHMNDIRVELTIGESIDIDKKAPVESLVEETYHRTLEHFKPIVMT